MISVFSFVADNTGIIFVLLLAILVVAAIVRIIVKLCRGEGIEITPVGIANDLPDSVTGMNRYSDALNTEEPSEKE